MNPTDRSAPRLVWVQFSYLRVDNLGHVMAQIHSGAANNGQCSWGPNGQDREKRAGDYDQTAPFPANNRQQILGPWASHFTHTLLIPGRQRHRAPLPPSKALPHSTKMGLKCPPRKLPWPLRIIMRPGPRVSRNPSSLVPNPAWTDPLRAIVTCGGKKTNK